MIRMDKTHRKKGFIFTLDAILSIIIAGLLITMTMMMSQQAPIDYTSTDLHIAAMDYLTVLEKDGTLRTAVETNSTNAMQAYLNTTHPQMCANITIYNNASAAILSTGKTGCNRGDDLAVARRVFLNSTGAIYSARMQTGIRQD
jgi:hypothetical protein